MSDVALFWFDYGADIDIQNGDIAGDNGLASAVLISLFTDARAPSLERLPEGEISLRGWWGDSINSENQETTGSLLWLLFRSKAISSTAESAFDYCKSALQWILDLDIAEKVLIDSSIKSGGTLQIIIKISRGSAKKYEYLWEDSLNYQKVTVQKSSIELIFEE